MKHYKRESIGWFIITKKQVTMKQIILLHLLVTSCTLTYAQDYSIKAIEKQFCSSPYSMYTYGNKITSSKSNLQNLFENIPRFLTNAEEVELYAFTYIGNVTNKNEARKYIKANIYENPKWTFIGVGQGFVKGSKYTGPTGKVEFKITVYEKYPAKEKRKAEKAARKAVQLNDEIWSIQYIYQNKTYTCYEFIDPQTYKVRTEGDVWYIVIPQNVLQVFESK